MADKKSEGLNFPEYSITQPTGTITAQPITSVHPTPAQVAELNKGAISKKEARTVPIFEQIKTFQTQRLIFPTYSVSQPAGAISAQPTAAGDSYFSAAPTTTTTAPTAGESKKDAVVAQESGEIPQIFSSSPEETRNTLLIVGAVIAALAWGAKK